MILVSRQIRQFIFTTRSFATKFNRTRNLSL